jgi:hypothetical protein
VKENDAVCQEVNVRNLRERKKSESGAYFNQILEADWPQAGQENQRILRSTPALLQHPAAPAMTALFFLHRDLSPRAALLGKPEARRGYQASSPTPQALWMAD